MKHFVFRLKEGSTVEDALFELEEVLRDIYEIDDPETGSVHIGGYSDSDVLESDFSHVVLESSSPVEEIDWQKQWSDYAPDFHQGLAHIDLAAYGGVTLLLQPGEGFGDFSHPTTRLALKLMAPLVKNHVVFDIGCGSGILTVAAVLLGAKRAVGVDIHEEALKHAQINAKINHVEDKVRFAKILENERIEGPYLIVMNMIETEQKLAWDSVISLHTQKALVVTSGILSAQKDPYLRWTKKLRWQLLSQAEEEGWTGFLFKA